MSSDADVSDAQTAGLLMAVAALVGAIRAKGLLDAAEIDGALAAIEADIQGSKLAQATPQDRLVQATLAPLQRLRRLNDLFDPATGRFPDWIRRADEGPSGD
ncbi:MAG: hypothetical protein VYB54_09965 [Pseudomonadota bacterium]|nr:hypothetical protein [Pseudomonadota bacterium]